MGDDLIMLSTIYYYGSSEDELRPLRELFRKLSTTST